MARYLPMPSGEVDDIKAQYGVMAHAQRLTQPYINAAKHDTLGAQEIVETTTYVLDGGVPNTLVENSDWINAGDLDGGDI